MTATGIGVVVLNWNGHKDTVTCLESLVAAEPAPASVVVVDNGSTDDSLGVLQRWALAHDAQEVPPRVQIVSSPANRGFSAGNNLGIARLVADPAIGHFLLLNNDATVQEGFFRAIGDALVEAPDAGILGPTIYVSGQPGAVWYAGGHFVPLRSLVVHDMVIPAQGRPVRTEFVTGCAMLISRRAWEMLGPLPECYFIYLEDAEYSWRARVAGFPVLYAPQAVAYHAVGATVGRSVGQPQVEYWRARNRALFVRRNLRGWTRWGALAYLLVTKPGRAVVEVLRGRPTLGWAFVRGTAAGLWYRDGS